MLETDMNCYYGWNKDISVLKDSASGGIFSAIAETILSQKGVVFGAAIDCETSTVRHIPVETAEQLSLLRRSKYQQSNTEAAFHQVAETLSGHRRVLFSGTPCQVAGLKCYLSIKRIPTEDLFTVEVLCHGVTNTKVVQSYIRSIEAKYKRKVVKYHFRTKDKPWYHSGSSMHICFEDGKEIYRNHAVDELYLVFGRNVALRPSCHACPFAKEEGRPADITIGDFWGAEEYIKDKDLLKQGIGLILTNTDRGEAFWKELTEQNKVTSEPLDIKKALPRNGALTRPARANAAREAFFLRLEQEDFIRLVHSIFKKVIFKEKIKRFIGYDRMRKIRKLRGKR